jgi:hypothetical protein
MSSLARFEGVVTSTDARMKRHHSMGTQSTGVHGYPSVGGENQMSRLWMTSPKFQGSVVMKCEDRKGSPAIATEINGGESTEYVQEIRELLLPQRILALSVSLVYVRHGRRNGGEEAPHR